jgi:hypothetical protein
LATFCVVTNDGSLGGSSAIGVRPAMRSTAAPQTRARTTEAGEPEMAERGFAWTCMPPAFNAQPAAAGVEQSHHARAHTLRRHARGAMLPPPSTGGRMAKSQWAKFPHDAKAFAYAGDALKKAWPQLHAGDAEPFPDSQARRQT